MFVRFDRNTLNVDVLVGVEESYSPVKEVIDVRKKADDLKQKTERFIEDTFKTKETKSILDQIEKDKELEATWKSYLANVYNKEVSEIEVTVNTLNKQG